MVWRSALLVTSVCLVWFVWLFVNVSIYKYRGSHMVWRSALLVTSICLSGLFGYLLMCVYLVCCFMVCFSFLVGLYFFLVCFLLSL
jgi:hypothetical protein